MSLEEKKEALSWDLKFLRLRKKKRLENCKKIREQKEKPNVLQLKNLKDWKRNISAKWMSLSCNRSVIGKKMKTRKSKIDWLKKRCYLKKSNFV
jgi:hypothetical protein